MKEDFSSILNVPEGALHVEHVLKMMTFSNWDPIPDGFGFVRQITYDLICHDAAANEATRFSYRDAFKKIFDECIIEALTRFDEIPPDYEQLEEIKEAFISNFEEAYENRGVYKDILPEVKQLSKLEFAPKAIVFYFFLAANKNHPDIKPTIQGVFRVTETKAVKTEEGLKNVYVRQINKDPQ